MYLFVFPQLEPYYKRQFPSFLNLTADSFRLVVFVVSYCHSGFSNKCNLTFALLYRSGSIINRLKLRFKLPLVPTAAQIADFLRAAASEITQFLIDLDSIIADGQREKMLKFYLTHFKFSMIVC